MQNVKRISIILLISMSLPSCAGTNVSGEWDCPKQNGHGCIDIERADDLAIKKLADRQKKSASKEADILNEQNNKIGNIREIWIAPFQDVNGNYHESTKIKYRE